jgi:two-component system, OmpR family, copper resistance phosphate regulon response regulator CusR
VAASVEEEPPPVPGRVLLAHEPHLAALIQPALDAAGLLTTTVADGDAALAHGLSGCYDVLLLGTALPRRDGLTVVRQLRAAGVPVPIILLGCDEAEHIAAGLDAGADDYVGIPPRTDELLARIRLRVRRANGLADLPPVTRY